MMDFMKALQDPETMAQLQSFPTVLQEIRDAVKLQICFSAAIYESIYNEYPDKGPWAAIEAAEQWGLGDTLRWARAESIEPDAPEGTS